MSKEMVEEDVKNLIKQFPELKNKYRIEPSETPQCYHVAFPRSEFKTFEEALRIAESSKCDLDWLALCRRYSVFGLRTKGIKHLRDRSSAVRGAQAYEKKFNRPRDEIASPIKLVLKPFDSQDLKRIIKVSEAIEDETWTYKIEQTIANPAGQVVIGCKDKWQAERRVKFIEVLGIVFTHEIER